ncbi:PKD domain-containing protein [Streptomyces sp. NPDC059533]|uniref:PKD domain-containing protein n=1 Tax=unclassified Streptomyces TaxID=2593676 RepID=UPI00368C932F
MRPTRATALLTAGLVTLFGAPAGAAAAAEAPANLYVNNQAGSNCSDSGSGTQAVPYCTVSAAAKVVQPGQTVRIKSGTVYDENVTISRSGEPGKPISFVPDGTVTSRAMLSPGKGLTIGGSSHVKVERLVIRGGIQVKGSSDVQLDQVYSRSTTPNSLVIGEGSSDVRVSRSSLVGVLVDGGSRNTVLSRNTVQGIFGPVIAAVDAPGTVITNNTLTSGCAATVSVSGGSTGSGLHNNVLITQVNTGNCPLPDARNAVLVSKSAAVGTVADYNVVAADPALFPAPYNWSGTTYKDPAVFRAATGQGAHDISVTSIEKAIGYEGAAAIDSADATAPGVLPTDHLGNAAVDDPLVPNTGKDGGYLDRGATEFQDWLSEATLTVDPPHAPVGTEVAVRAFSNSRWPTTMSYQVDFGDGSAPVDAKRGEGDYGNAKHTYAKPGDYVVKVTAVNGVGKTASTEKTVKAAPAGPGTASFTATQVLPPAGDTEEHIAPLTYAFDVSSSVTPWPVARMEVDFGEGWYQGYDGTTRAQHTYAKPGEYKATVKVTDTKGGTATTTRTVRVDYAPSGYVPVTPYRLQDTRTWGGALKGAEPTAVPMPLAFKTGDFSTAAGMSAVVLNVTLTEATQDAFLSVSPNREETPATSNVNVRKGGTTSNTVTVPVDEHGWVWMRLNAGQAALIVDFVGFYQPNAGQKFSPVSPTRVADTREAGGALGGGQTRTVKVAGVAGVPAGASAVALNLTSTDTTAGTFVTAYPDPANRPATSNLNPEPGKAKSSQVLVPVGPNGTITLYNHWGSTHLVVDVVGFYGKDGKALFTPVVPKRLADTRDTGKLAQGATTTAAGVPAGAVGAVVNLTATESAGAGYLTAYGFGAARPNASSLNTLPGVTVPNHVTTPVGDGRISVYNGPWGGSTHVITDLLGYFTQG